MPVYAACCCVEEAETPCSGPGALCPPVAILVEGRASVGIDASFLSEWQESCNCGICGSEVDSNLDHSFTGAATEFATVNFKALLVRTTSFPDTPTPGGDSYSTGPASSEFPPLFSVQGGVSANFAYNRTSVRDHCLLSCQGQYSFVRKTVQEQLAAQDEIQVNSFRIDRFTTPEFCDDVPVCLTSIHGDGCYEQYRLQCGISLPVDVSGDFESLSTSEETNPWTGECFTRTLFETPYYSCESFAYRPFNLSMTRYARIRPEEAEINVCPLDEPRTLSGIIPDQLGTTNNKPFDVCEPCGPCECGGSNIDGAPVVSNGGANQYGFSTAVQCDFDPTEDNSLSFSFPFQAPKCLELRSSEISQTNDTWEDQISANCHATIETCLRGQDNPNNEECPSGFGGCTSKSTFTTEACPWNEQATYQFNSSVTFLFTRHELLYELPDPAEWPNV